MAKSKLIFIRLQTSSARQINKVSRNASGATRSNRSTSPTALGMPLPKQSSSAAVLNFVRQKGTRSSVLLPASAYWTSQNQGRM